MDQDKISVIVPVYNTAPYLPACIGSILAQTHSNLEVLLIDDGSADNSGALCDVFAQKDPRIKVIHKTNMGVSAARNDGIDAATGAWLAFVDSDDVISEQMMEKLHDLAVGYDAEIAVCGLNRLTEQSSTHFDVKYGKIVTFSRKEALRNFITTCGYGGFLCNKLFRVDLFQKPELLRLNREIAVCEDLLMTCLLTERADVIACTNEKLYGYVVRSGSAMETVTEKTLSSLMAKKQLIEIYTRNGLPDGASRYAYALANILTFRNSDVVKNRFEELLADFETSRKLFVPQLHSRKEIMIFYTMAAAPRLFSRLYGELRSIRSMLWKKEH